MTAGVAINVGQYGLVMAYTAILLPQLRNRRIIPIDEVTGSWIGEALSVNNILTTNLHACQISYRYITQGLHINLSTLIQAD